MSSFLSTSLSLIHLIYSCIPDRAVIALEEILSIKGMVFWYKSCTTLKAEPLLSGKRYSCSKIRDSHPTKRQAIFIALKINEKLRRKMQAQTVLIHQIFFFSNSSTTFNWTQALTALNIILSEHLPLLSKQPN